MSDFSVFAKTAVKALFTLVLVAAIGGLAVVLWRAYVLAPWTRDGRISAQVIRIAPEVSGTVLTVPVADNQFVTRGTPLFTLDPARFRIAVSQAEAQLKEASATVQQKRDEALRRRQIAALMAVEDVQRAREALLVAEAQQQQAAAALALAELNLQRATLRSPVDGFVTHLRLQPGDYAQAGSPTVAVVDVHSFWVTGYFEETKLHAIHTGDPVAVQLMGDSQRLAGHVVSVGRGISDSNQQVDDQGLPGVEATFSWIRLAQRIPVRIELDAVPPGTLLTAGMSCSIAVAGMQTAHGRMTALLARWL